MIVVVVMRDRQMEDMYKKLAAVITQLQMLGYKVVIKGTELELHRYEVIPEMLNVYRRIL